jgi:hypothetical protein
MTQFLELPVNFAPYAEVALSEHCFQTLYVHVISQWCCWHLNVMPKT